MAWIWFFATSKSGLGHLRRCSSIAKGISRIDPSIELGLITNAPIRGLSTADFKLFSTTLNCERSRLANELNKLPAGPLVIDTAVVPGIETTDRSLILVLREMPLDRLAKFNLAEDRPWDLVIVPNPKNHWSPDASSLRSKNTVPVGWIYRKTEPVVRTQKTKPFVLVATGGGGTEETASQVRDIADKIILAARTSAKRNFEVVQAIGQRLPSCGVLQTAETTFDPGADLNRHFAEADVVISTAGYNSVLELAETERPALLIPVPRNIDDQAARVTYWGKHLGHGFDGNIEKAASWLVTATDGQLKRNRFELDPSGHNAAAKLIVEYA